MSSTDETRCVTLEEIRAMRERGELAAIADDAPEADLPDAFRGEAEVVRRRETLTRYWIPQGGGVEPHDAGLLYLRDDVDAVIAALAAERDALRAERERLALAICGGEDAPGYAGTQTVEALESVAMQNRNMHASTVNSLLRAETERDALRAEVERLRADAAKLVVALREADVFIKQNMGGLRNTKRDAILAEWDAK